MSFIVLFPSSTGLSLWSGVVFSHASLASFKLDHEILL